MSEGSGLLRGGCDTAKEPSDLSQLGDERENLHVAAAESAEQRVELVHFTDQLCPGELASAPAMLGVLRIVLRAVAG